MNLRVTLMSLFVVTLTSVSFAKHEDMSLKQCLKQAKIVASAIDSVEGNGRNRATEEVNVALNKTYSEATLSETQSLSYSFGDVNGESYLIISFNIDDGCRFSSSELVVQD